MNGACVPVHCNAEWTGGLAQPVRSADERSGQMEIILNRDQAMKAVDVARKFAASASGLKVLVRPEVAFDE